MQLDVIALNFVGKGLKKPGVSGQGFLFRKTINQIHPFVTS